MALNPYVLRWGWTVGTDNIITFGDASSGGTQRFLAFNSGDYITRGENTSGALTDAVAQLETECNGANTSMGLGGTVTVTLGTDGKLVLSKDSGSTLYIQWPDTTFPNRLDGEQLGFDTSTHFAISTTPSSPPYQVAYCWYPGPAPTGLPTRDTERRMRRVFSEQVCIGGRVVRNVHDSAPHYTRELKWPHIPSARILQSRADDSAYATVAGITAGDPNVALENLMTHALNPDAPEPGQIYVYNTADPSTHTEAGPFFMRVPKTFPMQGGAYGVTDEMVVGGFSSEHYRVELELTEV